MLISVILFFYLFGFSGRMGKEYAKSNTKRTGQSTVATTTINAKTNTGGVSSEYKASTKTRPQIMKAVWLIKLW